MEKLNNIFLDLKALSKYSALAVPTLRDYLKGPDPIPHFKVRGKIIVRLSEFNDWLETYRVDAGQKLGAVVDGIMADLST